MDSRKAQVTILFAFLLMSFAATADDYARYIKVFKDSPVVQEFFNNSYGYAVFPTIGKGGIGIGAAHGSGQTYVGGKVTGKTTVTQLSVGFQFGGQAYSQMIFFEDKRAYDEFTSGNFEFGAQASAIAITAGAQAQAGSTGATASANTGPKDAGAQKKAQYHKGIVVFTHVKGGLMYEASLAGQKYSFEPIKKSD
ncbi:MAG: YSC84-related protein [Gammaproteobacteria bacterium]|jgi:lipid-binding SYLF domain-containing protein